MGTREKTSCPSTVHQSFWSHCGALRLLSLGIDKANDWLGGSLDGLIPSQTADAKPSLMKSIEGLSKLDYEL